MSKIRIKNFGPIKNGFSENNGFIEITPITLICGNQATGKSSIAKLYSTFSWLEKKLDFDEKYDFDFVNTLLSFHQIDCYVSQETEIEYIGEIFDFSFKNGKFSTNKKSANYIRPKILYIPADRSFCTSIRNPNNVKGLPRNTFDFLSDFMDSALALGNEKFNLPLNGFQFRYDSNSNRSFISDKNKNYEIETISASSGLQSVSPMTLTSEYFSKKFIGKTDKYFQDFSLEQKKKMDLGIEKNRIVNSRFINIVEEPEQNLYPDSQSKVLYELLECKNIDEKNQILITTHSPYILAYLTLSAEAFSLLKKGVPVEKIEKIVPKKSAVKGESISIYETHDDGSITKLSTFADFLPSDDNLLNNAMAKSDELFSEMLELEQEFCN